jgi:Beta-glucosidase-related glycosidases
MIMGGLSPSEAGETIFSYARAGIRAFLFPGCLIAEPERLKDLVSRARSEVSAAGSGRALIAIGGNRESSFGLPPLPLAPSPLALASCESSVGAKRTGAYLASILAPCGVDMVLAPRLDLASDPKEPSGALEGFGEDARLAGILGSAYAKGLARAGLLTCVGRFPGLGAVCHDCYEGMPFIALPVERLERCEMRPFAQAVSGGVAAVLVGRVLVPSLESSRIPASSSARIIEGRLREAMGFRGLVVGDDINPGEVAGKAAVLGALAGCDLGLFSRPMDALDAAAALDKAMSSGELPAVRVEMARRRFEQALDSKREVVAAKSVARAASLLLKTSGDIERSVTLLRGSLVLDAAEGRDFGTVLVLVFLPPDDAPDSSERDSVVSRLQAELPGAEVLALPANAGKEEFDRLAALLSVKERFAEAVILSYDAHFRPAQEGVARLVEETLPRFRVVAMRDPYDAAFFPRATGLGAAYGFSEGSARAVARILAGKAKPRGGHPVEVIGLEV